MKYYIYIYEHKYVNNWDLVTTIDDYEDLIHYLYRFQEKVHYYGEVLKGKWVDNVFIYRNSFLDRLNMTGHDTYVVRDRIFVEYGIQFTTQLYIRPYMVKDEDGRIIDVRRFYQDIENYTPEYRSSRSWHFWRGSKPSRYERERNAKLGRVVRMVNHPDFEKYNRKRPYKKVLSNLAWWDYPPRNYDRSWKSSCKIKKQWMKHEAK